MRPADRLFRPRSFRWRFLFVVFVTAVLPLALIGFWVTRSAVNAGESLLRSELDGSLTRITAYAEQRWAYRRGQLVLLAGNEATRRLMADSPSDPFTAADSAYLARTFATTSEMIPAVEFRDATGRLRWSMNRKAVDDGEQHNGNNVVTSAPPAITVRMPINPSVPHASSGRMTARVRLDYLLPADTGLRVPNGGALQVIDQATGTALLATRLPDSVLLRNRFTLRDGDWLSSRQAVRGAPLEIVVAAPTQRYIRPFQRAARTGAIAVALVALLAIVMAAYLTRRLTRSLEMLADAADAVARGELAHHVEGRGADEVGRVAAAFNSMTGSLRRTLGELSQRQALAAVGEYAASMAHEVRNALTALRVDLQQAEEALARGGEAQPLIARSLAHVKRLDSTVSHSLRVARDGRLPRRRVDLRQVLTTATQSAQGAFAEHGSRLGTVQANDAPVWVRGDLPALEQLFLNLLLNSAQAMSRGGRADVALEIDGAEARVVVSDNGPGIPAADLSRVLESFYSTKVDGNGLGLPIARQIATAHGGSLRIESVEVEGTRVEVRLPLA